MNHTFKHIFINGSIIPEVNAHIHTNDRGFLLGDGLFETCRAELGDILFFNEHLERLEKSAKFFSIPLLYDRKQLLDACKKLLHSNSLMSSYASLRITLTRGTGARGINILAEQKPTLMITAAEYLPSESYHPTSFITSIKRNQHSIIVKHKTLNYLESILARREAQKNGSDEGIMINVDDFITESSCANIFFAKDGEIITPNLDSGILPGITRKTIIDLCLKNNILITEKNVSIAEALNADEAFQTNSLVGIQSLSAINNKKLLINKNDVVLKIVALYQQSKKSDDF